MGHKNIIEYMNSRSNRTYLLIEVAEIANAIIKERKDRKLKGLQVNTKSALGKEIINKRTAGFVNNKLNPRVPLRSEDIRLYKQCVADEYMDRTGKCAWGYKDVRQRLGYDPSTGIELQ